MLLYSGSGVGGGEWIVNESIEMLEQKVHRLQKELTNVHRKRSEVNLLQSVFVSCRNSGEFYCHYSLFNNPELRNA